ncbi:MAG: ABC transporter ATP-binding protein [Anaerolineae bacterium]|nr:ABC transporter ATP-binding protein [Anaerolineae bacterium]
MIELHHLTKQYGDHLAVDRLDLSVPAGELFGFLGPNGAGKTTTIKMCTGLLSPTAGSAAIGGHDVIHEGTAARALIGYVPDTPDVYTKLTGREFVRFMADIYRVAPQQRDRRIEELLEMLDLKDAADDLVETYSHGMKQKTVLAGALVHDPKVLFLDEPTQGLDPRSARLVKDILRALCERGATVFMSTHVLEIAERICDRVGIIYAGRLVALGTIEELRHGADKTLEDIFLEVTGSGEVAELVRFLNDAEAA